MAKPFPILVLVLLLLAIVATTRHVHGLRPLTLALDDDDDDEEEEVVVAVKDAPRVSTRAQESAGKTDHDDDDISDATTTQARLSSGRQRRRRRRQPRQVVSERHGAAESGGATSPWCGAVIELPSMDALWTRGPHAGGSVHGYVTLQCGNVVNGYENVFSFRPPESGRYSIDTNSSVNPSTGRSCGDPEGSVDTVIQVRQGGASECAGQVLACNDDALALGRNKCSRVNLDLFANVTYLIEVAQYGGASWQFENSFNLTVRRVGEVYTRGPSTLRPTSQPVFPSSSSPTHSPTRAPSPFKKATTKTPTKRPSKKSQQSPPPSLPDRAAFSRQTPGPTFDWGLDSCSFSPTPMPTCVGLETHPLRKGFYDVVGQGFQNDYCRYTRTSGLSSPKKKEKNNPILWVCALSTSTNQYSAVFGKRYGCTSKSSSPTSRNGSTPPKKDWGCVFYPQGPSAYDLRSQGGLLLPKVVVYPTYLGSSWAASEFQSDIVQGHERFYSHLQGTMYAENVAQYLDGGASPKISFAKSLFDTKPYSTAEEDPGARLCAFLIANNHTIDPRGYYPLFTDIQRRTEGYCAYHWWTRCGGAAITYGFFFDTRNDVGCGSRITSIEGRSPGLTSLVNIGAHELFEVITDPLIDDRLAFVNFEGLENADICAWVVGAITLSDRSEWMVQALWSNSAHREQIGEANLGDSEKGCTWGP